MKKLLITSLATVALILGSGCASIVSGTHKEVKIYSDPSGAKFTIYNKAGTVVESHVTPATISLERGSGYFSKEQYKLVFEQTGYYTGETQIKGSLNTMYFGNLIFGGLLGLLIVDPITGAMWTIDSKELTYNLVPVQAGLSPEAIKDAQAKLNPDPSAKAKASEKTDKKPTAG